MLLPFNLGTMDWNDWVRGVIGGFIGGGAASITTGAIVGLKDPKDWGWGAGLFELIGLVFIVNGIFGACLYLAKTPLPPVLKTTEHTVEKTEVLTPKPSTTVVTTDKEIEVASKLPRKKKH